MLDCKFRPTKDKANGKPKVCMLTTGCNTEIVDTGEKDRNRNPIMKSAVINYYNHHMGGVDQVDQQLHAIHYLEKVV